MEIYCFISHRSFVSPISFVSVSCVPVRSLRLSCRRWRSNTRRWPNAGLLLAHRHRHTQFFSSYIIYIPDDTRWCVCLPVDKPSERTCRFIRFTCKINLIEFLVYCKNKQCTLTCPRCNRMSLRFHNVQVKQHNRSNIICNEIESALPTLFQPIGSSICLLLRKQCVKANDSTKMPFFADNNNAGEEFSSYGFLALVH